MIMSWHWRGIAIQFCNVWWELERALWRDASCIYEWRFISSDRTLWLLVSSPCWELHIPFYISFPTCHILLSIIRIPSPYIAFVLFPYSAFRAYFVFGFTDSFIFIIIMTMFHYSNFADFFLFLHHSFWFSF